MLTLRRVHDGATEAIIKQEGLDDWRIQIKLRESNRNPTTSTGYLAHTVELAKALADDELLKNGHVCSTSCEDWVEILSTSP